MKLQPGTTVVQNGQLIDGTGAPPVPNAVVIITDGLISYAGPAADAPATPPDARVIDAKGGTIMPGLIEAHIHLTYFNVTELQDLDIKYPVEYVTLQSAVNAKTALECGYTSARSGGCLHNIDVWMKKAIEEDMILGPRLSASGREICGAGGLMDWNPDYRRIGMEGIVFIVNGPEQARTAVRKLVKDGIEWVKTYPTGDAASPDINDHHTLCMTFDEMHAVVATAHNHGLKVTGHCRATEGICNALKSGYDAIEHGTFMDDECLDLLLKRNVPMCPGLGFELFSVERGKDFGLSQRVIDGHQETLEAGAESCRKVLKAGGTMGLGGDYGFGWTPHGTYAQELTFFVNYVGFTPLQTITCATLGGAKMMGRAHELGTLEKGKLADVLVVNGDVLQDISILENRDNLLAVMQGGVIKAGTLVKPASL
ncbi:amidohydrolase family protein [Prosthecobacter sp.]|uniref:metal-dependent hydrolase family protein n=1 Tax=Prosthecobacter sp. TaxID=1965333 RepID=UPI001DA66FA7|nr:amidohydrolase family protein [Prosthecobacter sp.]MCB1275697.1 amidohydrolase family protein [Prosthecobacter sp.]